MRTIEEPRSTHQIFAREVSMDRKTTSQPWVGGVWPVLHRATLRRLLLRVGDAVLERAGAEHYALAEHLLVGDEALEDRPDRGAEDLVEHGRREVRAPGREERREEDAVHLVEARAGEDGQVVEGARRVPRAADGLGKRLDRVEHRRAQGRLQVALRAGANDGRERKRERGCGGE